MIKEKLKLIKEGKMTAEQNITGFLEKIKKQNRNLNIILHINEKAPEQARKVDEKIKKGRAGELAGLGFVVKSNINVEGMICNCGSRTLENYRAGYNASVIDKLLKEDAVVLGMANMDEFACGASGETSAFGNCKNPRALDRIPGGSSSGSAASVAAGFCDFALGSDTGGSIRNPASHCGVAGMKPSYGMVSRYGLIDLSMSLDQIGPLANSVEDCELILGVIRGRDERDAMTRDFKEGLSDAKKIRLGILNVHADRAIWEKIRERIKNSSKTSDWKVGEPKLNYINLGVQAYYPIVYSEFFSGTRKFDGRKYGFRIEESCGEEVLRRILGGGEITKAEYAGKYYRKALAAKKIIEEEFEKAFKNYDILVCPTVPRLPHKIGERVTVEDMYNYDALTVLANLSEIPAISIPCGEIEGVPIGIQLLARRGEDSLVMKVAKKFEDENLCN